MDPTTDEAWDLYREVHKAMRFALFGVITMAGATDPRDETSIEGFGREWVDVRLVLTAHHGHEDAFCDPLIRRHAGPLREELEAAHRASEHELARLDRSVERLLAEAPPQRGRVLQLLHLDLAGFTAGYLGHLRFEEEQVMPALNAALTNDELAEVTQAIRMSVPPDDMCTFIRYMAPAMNVHERIEMLKGMKAAPEEVFAMFRQATEACLSVADYAAVATGAGLNS
jgi:hemerythrin-like domain-containing protein